jgi:hypothetical protein
MSMRKIKSKDNDNGKCAEPIVTRDSAVEQPKEKTRKHRLPRSYRELGEWIFKASDPVKAGAGLLEPNDDDRGAANRLRSLVTFAGWLFGEREGEGDRKPPRIIWDIPGPPYEPPDPELRKLEGGEE